MKILSITFWYPNSLNPLNGIFVKRHINSIKLMGNDVRVLSIYTLPSKRLIQIKHKYYIDEQNNIPVHEILIYSLFHKLIYLSHPLLSRIANKYLQKNIFNTFQPNIIHSHVIHPAGVVGHYIAQKYSIPHIITEHWSNIDKFMKKFIYPDMAKKAYEKATYITAVSIYLKNVISKYSDANKIIIVPNVIQNNIYTYLPKLTLSNDELVFTAIANWEFPKAPLYFIEALSRISKNCDKKIILQIIGEGSLLDNIKDKKSTLTYNIQFLGLKTSNEIANILQRSNFLLHASYMETFSLVIAESLHTGTPVIASNVGAISELLNDKNGITCNNSIEDWIKAINQAINTIYDYQEISNAVKNLFSLKTIGEQFNNVYKKAMNLN